MPVRLSEAGGYLDASALERSVTFDAGAESAVLGIGRGEFLATATQSGDLTASVVAGESIVAGTPSSATVRMVVADPTVTVRMEQASYRFVEGASATSVVVLARTAAGLPQPNRRFYVGLVTREVQGGATASTDYAPLSKQLKFAPSDFARAGDAWQARKEVLLTILDDTVDETGEALNVVLGFLPGNPGRTALVEADGHTACGRSCVVPVTIMDNDATPSAPRDLTLEPDDGEVALGWEAPADDGGNAVRKYQYRVSADDGATWAPDWTDIAHSAPGQTNSTTYLVTGLDSETTYRFELRAVNATGPGASAAGTATTPVGTVTGVEFLPPGKTYAIGDTIRVKASFSHEVEVVTTQTAKPYIELDLGGSAKRAYFTRLDGSDSLVFGYTVQRGDIDTDGISIDANSLTVVDGSSISTAGGPVALEHAAVGMDPTRKVDGVPPAVSSATVDGTRLVLAWSEGLDEHSVPAAPGGFAVTAEDSVQTVSALSVRGVEVTLTLAAPLENGQTVTVSYAAPGPDRTGDSAHAHAIGAIGDTTDGDSIRDIAGNGAESFAGHAVTNTTAPPPELSVADAEAMEGAALTFRVTLDRPAREPVTVDWATADGTAEAGADYEAARNTLSFASGETEKTVEIVLIDDLEDEQIETLTLTLSNARGARIAVGRATGRIANTDVIPAAWLARFGRTAADQVLDAVDARLKAPRRSGFEGRMAGTRLDGGRTRSGTTGCVPHVPSGTVRRRRLHGPRSGPGRDDGNAPPHVRSRELTDREMILGTSFALTGGLEGGASASVWGRAAVTGFQGRAGGVPLDGEVATGMVGADYAQGPVTGGLLLSMSRGEGSYGSHGGDIETSLAGLYPYARYAVNERVSVWGVAGYGDGKLRLTPLRGRPREANIDLRMAAAGTRGTVLDGSEDGGFELAVESDALLLRIDSEEVPGLTATESDVSRLRLGLEGSWHGIEVAGGTLAPSVEVGVRHDDGDAETGFGTYIGGALAWLDPERGLSAEVEARGLLTHEDEGIRERGFAGSLTWDPKPSSDLGPSMSLRQSVGADDSGGVEALFGRGSLASLAEDATDGGRSRLEGTFGYGLPMYGGAFVGTPRLGFATSEDHRDVRLGWRLSTVREDGLKLALDLEGMRRESSGVSTPEHRFRLWLTMRW